MFVFANAISSYSVQIQSHHFVSRGSWGQVSSAALDTLYSNLELTISFRIIPISQELSSSSAFRIVLCTNCSRCSSILCSIQLRFYSTHDHCGTLMFPESCWLRWFITVSAVCRCGSGLPVQKAASSHILSYSWFYTKSLNQAFIRVNFASYMDLRVNMKRRKIY